MGDIPTAALDINMGSYDCGKGPDTIECDNDLLCCSYRGFGTMKYKCQDKMGSAVGWVEGYGTSVSCTDKFGDYTKVRVDDQLERVLDHVTNNKWDKED